jgi:hypothetical protein
LRKISKIELQHMKSKQETKRIATASKKRNGRRTAARCKSMSKSSLRPSGRRLRLMRIWMYRSRLFKKLMR